MTDISVQATGSFTTDDRPWLLGEAVGHQQPTLSTDYVGLLDFSLFTANTHYPNGFIPSGVVLGKVTATGRLGPYGNGSSNGLETAVGHLYNATRVPTVTSTRVAPAVVTAFAKVSESRLPANHGLDAAAKADLPLIKYVG